MLYFFFVCEKKKKKKLVGILGCMRWEPAENLIPLDPKIERTLKRIMRDKREAARMEQLPM